MSDDRQGKPAYSAEFLATVDQFVNLANELAKEQGAGVASAAILFAAGRYNSFNHLRTGGTKEDPADAVKFYTEEYRKAFLQNLSGALGPVFKKDD